MFVARDKVIQVEVTGELEGTYVTDKLKARQRESIRGKAELNKVSVTKMLWECCNCRE